MDTFYYMCFAVFKLQVTNALFENVFLASVVNLIEQKNK